MHAVGTNDVGLMVVNISSLHPRYVVKSTNLMIKPARKYWRNRESICMIECPDAVKYYSFEISVHDS